MRAPLRGVLLLSVLLLALPACAPPVNYRHALITDLIPLNTQRALVEQRLKGERLCLQHRDDDTEIYEPCGIGDLSVSVFAIFSADQLHHLSITVFEPQIGRTKAGHARAPRSVVAAIAERTYAAASAALERRFGRGAETAWRGRWYTADERISLEQPSHGFFTEQHDRWSPAQPRGPSDVTERMGDITTDAKKAVEQDDRARAAFLAKQLLGFAARNATQWNYGNALHQGHLILGELALAEGDVGTARFELLEAGRTPGSPQLNSFGPNMRLALQLLRAGETVAVRDYFLLCRRFWEGGGEELDRWDGEVAAGHLPDFGANLEY